MTASHPPPAPARRRADRNKSPDPPPWPQRQGRCRSRTRTCGPQGRDPPRAQEAPDILHIDTTQLRRDQRAGPARLHAGTGRSSNAKIRLSVSVFGRGAAVAGFVQPGKTVARIAHPPLRRRSGRTANFPADRAASHAYRRRQQAPSAPAGAAGIPSWSNAPSPQARRARLPSKQSGSLQGCLACILKITTHTPGIVGTGAVFRAYPYSNPDDMLESIKVTWGRRGRDVGTATTPSKSDGWHSSCCLSGRIKGPEVGGCAMLLENMSANARPTIGLNTGQHNGERYEREPQHHSSRFRKRCVPLRSEASNKPRRPFNN